MARLNHPGIVTLYEFGRSNGLYFFLMEYVDGATLRQVLQGGRISPREALAIVPAICDALQYAHDQGIVHRDIKPENILLDRRGRTKVADFGLAKLMESSGEDSTNESTGIGSSSAMTSAGKVLGTPRYMAPEQIEHPAAVDHRADIYALGVVFYQMLTGDLPGDRLAPPSKKVQIDVRLDEVVLRALEKNPALRYAQAGALKTDVEKIAMTEQPPGPSQSPQPAVGEKSMKHALRRFVAAKSSNADPRVAWILTVERGIVLPVRILAIIVLGYYFFFSGWFDRPSVLRPIVRRHLSVKPTNMATGTDVEVTNKLVIRTPNFQIDRPIIDPLQNWTLAHAAVMKAGLVTYAILSVVLGATLIWSRNLSQKRLQWLVFAAGALDAVTLGTLIFLSNGFDSNLYLLFPLLALHSAVAIPAAFPQLLLNFLVSLSLLIAGLFDRRMFMSPEDGRYEKPFQRMVLLGMWILCCYKYQQLYRNQKRPGAEPSE